MSCVPFFFDHPQKSPPSNRLPAELSAESIPFSNGVPLQKITNTPKDSPRFSKIVMAFLNLTCVQSTPNGIAPDSIGAATSA